MQIYSENGITPELRTIYLVRRKVRSHITGDVLFTVAAIFSTKEEAEAVGEKDGMAEWVAVSVDGIEWSEVCYNLRFAPDAVTDCSAWYCPSLLPDTEKRLSCARFVAGNATISRNPGGFVFVFRFDGPAVEI